MPQQLSVQKRKNWLPPRQEPLLETLKMQVLLYKLRSARLMLSAKRPSRQSRQKIRTYKIKMIKTKMLEIEKQ